MAICYYEGKGTEVSYEKAFFWWEKAAEQDLLEAQYYLGIAYYQVERFEKACYWWKRAAEQDSVEAQYSLGICYYQGIGVERSKEKAMYWLKKSCENSFSEACEVLKKYIN